MDEVTCRVLMFEIRFIELHWSVDLMIAVVNALDRTCALNVSIDRCRKIAEGWDPARRTLGTLESRDKHEFRWSLAELLRQQRFRSSKREMKWLYDLCCSQILFWRFDGCKDFVCSRFLRNSLFVFWVASGRELICSQENEFGMVRQGLLQHFVLAFIFLLVTVSTSQWGQTENLDVFVLTALKWQGHRLVTLSGRQDFWRFCEVVTVYSVDRVIHWDCQPELPEFEPPSDAW